MKLKKYAITKTELDTALIKTKEKREVFLKKTKDTLEVLVELSVNELKSKLDETTYKIKNLVSKENIGKKYDLLPSKAQKELNKLFLLGLMIISKLRK